MNKNSTKLIFLLSIFIMIFSFATLVFFFRVIQNKNQHTSKVLTTLIDKTKKKASASDLTKQISAIEQTRDEINTHFVDSSHIDSFIEYLENIGNNTGAKVAVEAFDTNTSVTGSLSVRISIEGSFTNVMRTIIFLENSPYQIHITKTYIKQESQSTTVEKNGESQVTNSTIWRADLSFSVLTSS